MTFEQHRRLAHSALRAGSAVTAERRLRELERQAPGDPQCVWLIGVAQLDQDKVVECIATLERLLQRLPDFAAAAVDLARAYRRDGRPKRAREQVRHVLERLPQHHYAWLAYADALVDLEQYADANVAFERAALTDPYRQQIKEAAAALLDDDRKTAEEIFRGILQVDASHIGSLCGLAALSLGADMPDDALRLLRHALKQCQHIPLAWRGMTQTLMALGELTEADSAARHLLKLEPQNPQSWISRAAVSARLLRQEDALGAYEQAARLQPQEVRLRLSIGHLQKTLGKRDESETSYKEVLRLDPAFAEAYWSLADLKNYTFSDAEVATMQQLAATGDLARSGRAQLHFALGKAFEQRERHAEAFASYADGNALRRLDAPFDIAHFEGRTERICATFDAQFFAERAGGGDPSSAPIFIVGLPRSGSTLIEQILASHPGVEGTMELPNIINITRELDHLAPDRGGYPQSVRTLEPPHLVQLGRRYLAEIAALLAGREHFTDKMPNNFSHIGLIYAILPNATIIDARRHPMDCCFSTFKQHFAEGQTFSYSLEDLGRYYRCYLSLMDHWDAVLPGKVLHVQYEDMVRRPETQIRRLLEHCRLPFDAKCLTFNETRRCVRTASAEQVRRPIYTSAVGHWQRFERELMPLRVALGDCLQRFEHLER